MSNKRRAQRPIVRDKILTTVEQVVALALLSSKGDMPGGCEDCLGSSTRVVWDREGGFTVHTSHGSATCPVLVALGRAAG